MSEYDETVVRAVLDRKVLVLPHLEAQLFIARCFTSDDATEGVLDAEFLYPYLWETWFKLHGHEPCELYDQNGFPLYL